MHRSNAAYHYEFSPLTREERVAQTKMIIRLFEHWQLTYRQQAIMLGLSPNIQASISRYKLGKSVLSSSRDMQDRIGHLLAIHKYLRMVYRNNKDLAYRWITTVNEDFDGHRPYDVIEKDGYAGLSSIRNYLETTSKL